MQSHSHDIIIIGAGLSGLSTAHFIKKIQPNANLVILEQSHRVGGSIQSFQENGFIAEWGAHGFLNNNAHTQELLSDLCIRDQTLMAPLKDFSRYICLGGRLRRIPQTPLSVLFSALVSFPSKLRVLADLWKTPIASEQTVADWVSHRFGRALLPFADAVATGTFAGDIHRLSIDAVMPQLREIEKKNGSVIRSFVGANPCIRPKNKRLPSMISFKNGMETLCASLANSLDIRFDQTVQKIQRDGSLWEVMTNQATHKADHVIIATNINVALPLLTSLLSPPVQKIPEARLVNVVLGFDSSTSIPHAFGYLAPEQEKRFSLGTLFSSQMFPGRAPAGQVLLETLVGGRRHPERCDLSDNELICGVLKDLKDLLNIQTASVFAKVLRPKTGIPQLELGHHSLQCWKADLEAKNSTLHILGFGWEAIGINDMVTGAKQVATKMSGQHTFPSGEIKKVYF